MQILLLNLEHNGICLESWSFNKLVEHVVGTLLYLLATACLFNKSYRAEFVRILVSITSGSEVVKGIANLHPLNIPRVIITYLLS